MTMSFSTHERMDSGGDFDTIDFTSNSYWSADTVRADDRPILKDKIRVPEFVDCIDRPRIDSLLNRSVNQFPATVLTGRSGMGKTAAAAAFSKSFEYVSWYTVESTDVAWSEFTRYFSAGLSSKIFGSACVSNASQIAGLPDRDQIAKFLVNRFSRGYTRPDKEKSLMVIDDFHHIFDAAWFEEFFTLLLHSLPRTTHLLLLCRSEPPGPIWRLRSKQMLNVLSEKVLAFDAAETETLFALNGMSPETAQKAQKECFGRVSRLAEYLNK